MDLQDTIARLKMLRQEAVGARFDELVQEVIAIIQHIAAEIEELE